MAVVRARPVRLLAVLLLLGSFAGLSVLVVPSASGYRTRAAVAAMVQTATTWTVTSTADTAGVCSVLSCTLRGAILAANASTGPDLIVFNIQPAGPQTISVGSGGSNSLPPINGDDTTIDASTQPGATAPGVILRDADAGGSESGFVLEGQRIVIRGFRIVSFDDYGVLIQPSSAGNKVAGNWIGTSDGATAAATGNDALHVTRGGNNTIGGVTAADRNVVSAAGNGADGIELEGSSDNVVVGNYVGMSSDGLKRLPNGDTGIEINGPSYRNRVGGVTPGERNVVSGNSGIGVQLLGIMQSDGTCVGPQNNLVEGNYLGIRADGKRPSPYGNSGAGLEMGVCAQNNTVGGTTAGARNIVSGNHDDGIQLDSGNGPNSANAVCSNTIQGNYVGLSPTGTAVRPNTDDGIDLDRGSCGNLVGGTTAGAANVVAGNQGDGIDLHEANSAGAATNSNLIQGNLVGLSPDGSTVFANLQNGINIRFSSKFNTLEGNIVSGNGAHGILVQTTGATSNTIKNNSIGVTRDGTAIRGNKGDGIRVWEGARLNTLLSNTVRGNSGAGITVGNASGSTNITKQNTISKNATSGNGGLGIDLTPATGVTPNDGGSSTVVGNLGVDFPVITAASTGSAKGTAPPGSTVELFAASADTRETNGEGSVFLASTVASSTGAWCTSGLLAAGLLTATATDGTGNTSEFAANVAVFGSQDYCSTAPPQNTSPPTVSGTFAVGQTVTALPGLWSGTTPILYAYQWQRCNSSGSGCADIAATSGSYVLADGDVGSTVRVVVTASNGVGSSSAPSAASPIIKAAADVTPPTVGTLNTPSSVTSSTFTISWTAGSDEVGITGYRIDVATDTGFSSFVAGYRDMFVGPALVTTVSGLSPSTTYYARVRATDAAGNVSTSSNVVSATTAPSDAQWVNDDFSRTVTGAWGSTNGYTWKVDNAPDFSVNGSAGVIAAASLTSRNASLPIAQRDVDVRMKFMFTTLPTSGWQGVYALARVGGTSTWYSLRFRSVAGGSDDGEIDVNSPAGLVKVGIGGIVPEFAAGTWYWLRFEVTGDGATTALRGRVWPDGVTEPTAWVASASDTTAVLQSALGVGIRTASSSTSQPVNLRVEQFSAQAPPAPQPPTNATAPTTAGLAEVGQKLTASAGTWSGGPASYLYQWQRCGVNGCVDIMGATSKLYLLNAADVGTRARVAVTAENTVGNTTATSTETDLVGTDPVVAAAGDIACDPLDSRFASGLGTASACSQQATSDLLVDAGLTTVLTLGDNVYDCGSASAFQSSYDSSWGRVKAITRPSIGNHEYNGTSVFGATDCTGDASGYFSYFGASAGPARSGYYSYDVGSWHVVALNSECYATGGCGVGSPQEQWLRADLASHPRSCTLAYWHKPRFSSGGPGSSDYNAFWQALYDAGAEIVLNGHDHIYERFAPQDPTGAHNPVAGIREFIAGTGGKEHYGISAVAPNSEVRNSDTFGVLKLSLGQNGYSWFFNGIAGSTFADSGTSVCH